MSSWKEVRILPDYNTQIKDDKSDIIQPVGGMILMNYISLWQPHMFE